MPALLNIDYDEFSKAFNKMQQEKEFLECLTEHFKNYCLSLGLTFRIRRNYQQNTVIFVPPGKRLADPHLKIFISVSGLDVALCGNGRIIIHDAYTIDDPDCFDNCYKAIDAALCMC